MEVLAVLLKEEALEKQRGAQKAQSRRAEGDNSSSTGVQVAYIDELMGAKDLVDEVR